MTKHNPKTTENNAQLVTTRVTLSTNAEFRFAAVSLKKCVESSQRPGGLIYWESKPSLPSLIEFSLTELANCLLLVFLLLS